MLASAVLVLAVLAGISVVLTGSPTSYLGIDRQGYNIHTPHVLPMEPEQPPPPGEAQKELGKETAGWWWVFQVPQITWSELREDLQFWLDFFYTELFAPTGTVLALHVDGFLDYFEQVNVSGDNISPQALNGDMIELT